MDEIFLFKSLDRNRKWVYGYPVKLGDYCAIISVDGKTIDADHKSVCSYTGFKSLVDTEIFSNDIIQAVASEKDIFGVVRFGIYDNKHYGYYIEWISDDCDCLRKDIKFWCDKGVFVVGNVNTDDLEKFRKVS